MGVPQSETGSGGGKGSWVKLVVAVAGLGIGIVLLWKFGVFEYVSRENIDNLKAWFDGLPKDRVARTQDGRQIVH